jgi:hypothetical protein
MFSIISHMLIFEKKEFVVILVMLYTKRIILLLKLVINHDIELMLITTIKK